MKLTVDGLKYSKRRLTETKVKAAINGYDLMRFSVNTSFGASELSTPAKYEPSPTATIAVPLRIRESIWPEMWNEKFLQQITLYQMEKNPTKITQRINEI